MLKKIVFLIILFFPINGLALIEVDITRGNLNPLPLAVSPLSIDEVSRKKFEQILKNFEQEHRDLDEILIRLQEKNTVDFLQIQRLKKRKLILKDKILEIQNKLEPDSIA